MQGKARPRVDAGGVLVMMCGWMWAVTRLQWLSEDGRGDLKVSVASSLLIVPSSVSRSFPNERYGG